MFKLGRLQFGFGKFWKNYPEFLIEAGEDVIEVHIPETGKLQPKDCDESFKTAEIFFAKFFPTFSYRFYSCHSWLLDDSLENILGAKSNVCQFKARFQEIDRDESDAILRYVFRRDKEAFILMEKARADVMGAFDGLIKYDEDAVAKLMNALIVAGTSMAICGNSRPASGSEHHQSHFLEMDFVRRG